MGTRFTPGTSGNPKGRPKGIPDRRTQMRSLLEPALPELIEKLLELARNGDLTALRMVLDRSMPPLRSQPEQFAFELDPVLPPDKAARSVVEAMARGDLPVDAGQAILDGLTAEIKLGAISALEARISALESALGVSK